MYEDDKIEFKIDAFTPDTIPMFRLAEYLDQLAKLFGNKDKVHFRELKKGSAIAVIDVEAIAAPKVKDRLRTIDTVDADKSVCEAFDKINNMLASDNAVGYLSRHAANKTEAIYEFSGRNKSHPLEYGAVTQAGTLTGVVVKVGGIDKTIPVHLQDMDGHIWKCEATVEQSKELIKHYYEGPIRVYGEGRWIQDENGNWQQKQYFRISSYEVLDNTPLTDFVLDIRDEFADAWGDDPLKAVYEERYGSETKGDN
ncbi:hypothetical protein GCM10011332_04250 [Terasakiella brassicae]|uniref:Uncharacterized protein n=1 Tax=Terasakiella brassicae TaxID=1634917 RepID=A0A917F6H4_9PROT|nr:hypothetical protein [Terasakiella brassicae]GGF54004.1 hypothetical protein GCM10011332_04250 [Terasakiella brassicae]